MVDLEGVTAKIERAQKQLYSLDGEISRFCESQQRLIAHEIEKKSGKQAWVFRGETPKVPVEYSIRMGEIAYHMRSALDHLVWQLAIANGQSPSNHNEFPVFRNHRAYVKAAKQKLKGLHPGAKSLIESYQPFHKHGGVGSQLWILHCLSNIDKHRHLNIAILYSRGPNIEIVEETGNPRNIAVRGYAKTGRLEKNTTLVAFDDSDALMEIEFRLSVDFADSGSTARSTAASNTDPIEADFDCIQKHGPVGRPVVDTLQKCLNDVQVICSLFGLNVTNIRH